MKLVTSTTAPDFAALREQHGVHDANYALLKLARTRAIYGTLYQRLQDVLHIDDEGCEVTITLRSHSKTLTLTSAETDECFSLCEIYGVLGSRLNALSAEILDLLAATKDALPAAFEGTNDPLMIQAHALCMPQPQATAEVASPEPTRHAA